MAENNNTLQSWTGYYGVEDTGSTAPIAEEHQLIDSVFARLEKMQKRITGEKIEQLEYRLTVLESELTAFLESGTAIG